MPRRTAPLPSRRDAHATTRALASLAASLAVANLALWFWPTHLMPDVPPPPPRPAEAIEIVQLPTTRQPPPPANLPPPPPPPSSDLPPVEVPDEVIVQEIVDDLPPVDRPPPRPAPARDALPPSAAPSSRPGPPAPPTVGPPGPPGPPAPPGPAPSPAAQRIVEQPDRTPRISQQRFPVYPPELVRDGLRARVDVRVLVSETGQVLDAEVAERARLDGDAEVPVASLPASMERAAVDAARRSRFRAARDAGERVRAWTTIRLTFDPGR